MIKSRDFNGFQIMSNLNFSRSVGFVALRLKMLSIQYETAQMLDSCGVELSQPTFILQDCFFVISTWLLENLRYNEHIFAANVRWNTLFTIIWRGQNESELGGAL